MNLNDVENGLYKKYEVTKLSNPEKEIDAIVLEFDDELSRHGIKEFARVAALKGYPKLAHDLFQKCKDYEN